MLIILLFERSFFHPYNFGWLHALIPYVDLSGQLFLPWGKLLPGWPSWVTSTPITPFHNCLNQGIWPNKTVPAFCARFCHHLCQKWNIGDPAIQPVNQTCFQQLPELEHFTLGSINIFMALMASITATCCGWYDYSCNRNCLYQGKLHIASTRRQINIR